jgi:dihydrofolate reductase
MDGDGAAPQVGRQDRGRQVVASMSMSLDGFVEDRDGGVGDVFAWCQQGDHATTAPGDGREFRTSRATAELLREAWAGTGAVVCGRRLFDLTHGWGGSHPLGVPVFVVTHSTPTGWAHRDAPFTFVVEGGVAAAVAAARDAAGSRTVAIASPDVARQCLDLGLLDAIAVDLVPVILGAGTPWFAGVAGTTRLAGPRITPGDGVTHLFYDVQR